MSSVLKPFGDSPLRFVAFPGTGYQLNPGRWQIQLGGVIQHPYQPNLRKKMLLKILANLLGMTESELMSPHCFRRIAPFVSDGAKGRRIFLQLGDGAQRLLLPCKTRSNGHFLQTLHVPDSLIERYVEPPPGRDLAGRVRTTFVAADAEFASAESVLHLLPRRGLSIISDIDDTIKESEISDRRQLLANTFMRPFRTVPGMAEVYREWEARGACFHYVSSSPWQLYLPLADMLASDSFPIGPVHLRYFRLRNHMLQRMVRIKRSGKATTIKRLIHGMPFRQFILVGDSGEKDFEIYRGIANRFSEQILAVLIRNLPHRPLPSEKIQKFRQAHPRVVCQTFATTAELAALGEQIMDDLAR